MAIIQCGAGHYYDNEKFSECPHCAMAAQAGGGEKESLTVALAHESRQVENYAVEYVKKNAQAPLPNPTARRDAEEEKTISIYQKKGVSRCIAGWLVCVEGEANGKDFPIYAGFNRIGRSHSNDIVLDDPQVSREEHCSVIYEEKKNVFYVFPKDGNLVYAGDEMVEQAQEVASGEVITIGGTKLEFVAFCKGEKRWAKKG